MADKFDQYDLPGTLALVMEILPWFSGKIKDDSTREFIQKKVSVFSGVFSKVDEGIWMSLIARLKKEKLTAVTLLLDKLDRFREKEAFRMTVVNAPITTVIIEVSDPSDNTGKKKIKKQVPVDEFGDNDPRVMFLNELADLVNDSTWGAEKVRDMLRTHQLATENTFAKHVLGTWENIEAWAENALCQLFDVKKLEDVTLEMVSNRLNQLAEKIPAREKAEINQGFWAYAFSRHPTLTKSIVWTGLIFIVLWESVAVLEKLSQQF